MRQGDDLADRLEGADLVVGPHHRDQRHRGGVCRHGGGERFDVEATFAVHREHFDDGALLSGKPLKRVQHRVVLDRGGQDAGAARVFGSTGPVDALDGQVVGLGASGGEHDVTGAALQRLRDSFARLLHHAPGPPPGAVQRTGVADLGELSGHCLDRSREHGGRGGVIHVRSAQCHGCTSVRPGPALTGPRGRHGGPPHARRPRPTPA